MNPSSMLYMSADTFAQAYQRHQGGDRAGPAGSGIERRWATGVLVLAVLAAVAFSIFRA